MSVVPEQSDSAGAAFKGHRWLAARYDALNRRVEQRLLGRLRADLLGGLSGDVLEVGVGTGANLRYYPAAVRLVGTEPDPYMLERARQKQADSTATIELRPAVAEALPFPDGSFDHVVCTLVLCTVADPRRALAEIRRVLRPDGRLHLIEHVRAKGWLGVGQDWIRPLWQRVAAGCHPNRRTEQLIEAAGFRFERLETGTLTPVTPFIIGVARPV